MTMFHSDQLFLPTEAFNELEALLEDSIIELEQIQNHDEDLWVLKLLEARNNSIYFEEDLAEFICGDHEDFPYLKGWEIEEMFTRLGFHVSPLNITRRVWVKYQLLKINTTGIIKIIQYGLFEKRKFKKDSPELYNLNYTKAENTFKTFITDCIDSHKGADLNKLLDLNVNVELLYSNSIMSDDEEINSLLEIARQKFFDKQEKQIAVEKLWDAFERIKSYYDDDKKKSSAQLVSILSGKINECDFNEEFTELTKIGNKNMIRHSEKDKNKIDDSNYLDYLFFRMMSLINLCLKEINKTENQNKM